MPATVVSIGSYRSSETVDTKPEARRGEAYDPASLRNAGTVKQVAGVHASRRDA
jgi:hypothetical protein